MIEDMSGEAEPLMAKVTKQSFIGGAMILLAAGVVTRILGFVPRIVLPRLIGAEGVGLYQLGYPFLIVLMTLITGGIPLAVAKWTAEAETAGDREGVRRVFRTALLLTLLLSLVFMAASLLLADWIVNHVLTDPRVYRTFLCMTPILPLAAVSSVIRGYYQGKQNMMPTAVSQIAETVLRIVFVLLLARQLLPWGVEWAAAGAMLGVVAGEIGGFLVLAWQYLSQRRRGRERKEAGKGAARDPVLRKLLALSVPVTGSRMVGSLSYLFESILTARSLAAAGIVAAAATAQYGALQGMIIPVVLLPTALTYSLAVSLIPSLSEAAARGDRELIHKRLHQSLRLALVTGAPFAVVMFLFADPLCRLLYDQAEIAPMLRLMAPAALFIYLQAPLQAALQALDKPGTALANSFVGAVVKLLLIVFLASRPSLGIMGALVAINVNIVLVTVLHAVSVIRAVGYRMAVPDLLKVGAAMIIMGAASRFLMNREALSSEWLNLAFAVSAGAIVYLVLMVAAGVVDRHDAGRLPLIGRWFR